MSKDNEKDIKEKKNPEKKETKVEKATEKKEVVKEKKETSTKEKKSPEKKEEIKKEENLKKSNSKKEDKKDSKKDLKKEKTEVETKDSIIREKAIILGNYLLGKLKEYRYVIILDVIVFLLLFFLIPKVIFDVKPFIWMTAFVIFTVLPTIGIYGMNKFRDKQIMFGFFFIYLLILLFIKKFMIIELYGITSQGNLDYTPAWLDAVFITCIILFFQYIGIVIVNLVRKCKKKNKKKITKSEK